jgi:hypothetical protein
VIVIAITAMEREPGIRWVHYFSERHMATNAINFESTMTEADFKRPLLDASEERLARELNRDSDFRVDSLNGSLLGRLLNLFSAKR